MRNPTRYTIQETIGWEEFEQLCISILFVKGHKDIKSAGKVKDGGRDAVVLKGKNEHTIFQISKEKDPLDEKRRNNKQPSKFWREYDKWTNKPKTMRFVFISSESLGSKKIDLMKELSKPKVEIIDIDEIVNFLDYDDTGVEMKKQYAIFSKDLQEVFGADNQIEKLNVIAQVIDNDANYNVTTVLSPPEGMPAIAGTAFSMQEGDVIKYFIPKSHEHYLRATPTGSVTLAGPQEELDQHLKAIRAGVGVQIPSHLVSDFSLKVGDKVIADSSKGKPSLTIGAVPDKKPRILILRSTSDPTNEVRSALHVTKHTLEEIVMNNHDKNEPLDFEVRTTAGRKFTANFKFQLERCRDAVAAYKYARLYNALQTETLELLIDDDGIERPIAEVAMNKGDSLNAEYIEVLHNLARIQEFYKVRMPNALAKGVIVKNTDRDNAELLVKVIDKGKAELDNLNSISFVLIHGDDDTLVKKAEEESALAVGGIQVFQFLSILGVNNFPMIQLILPRAKAMVTKIKDGESKFDVAILDKPYLRLYADDDKTPTATWNK